MRGEMSSPRAVISSSPRGVKEIQDLEVGLIWEVVTIDSHMGAAFIQDFELFCWQLKVL